MVQLNWPDSFDSSRELFRHYRLVWPLKPQLPHHQLGHYAASLRPALIPRAISSESLGESPSRCLGGITWQANRIASSPPDLNRKYSHHHGQKQREREKREREITGGKVRDDFWCIFCCCCALRNEVIPPPPSWQKAEDKLNSNQSQTALSPPPPLSIKIATRWLTCDDKQEQSTEIPWRTLNEFQFTIQSQKGKEKENNGLDAYFTYKNKTKNRKKK